MALRNLGTGNQQTRDELSSEPTTQPIFKIKQESIKIEECVHKVTKSTIGESWIVGSSTNGIVGTNTGTESGLQQVVGGSGRVESLLRVVSPNNIFCETFQFTEFNDTGVTTGTWTGGTLTLTSSQIAQSKEVYKDTGTITKATITITGTNVGTATVQLSADGGSNFETVTSGTEHTFTNTGTELKWKITAGVSTVTTTLIKVEYIN